MNDEKLAAAESEECCDEPCGDSAEQLLNQYERRKTQRMDDVAAMQAVLCVLLAAALFAANMLYPEISGPLFEKLMRLTSDEREIMPNLIDVILSA